MPEEATPHAGIGAIATSHDPLLPASMGSFLMMVLQMLFPTIS